jgi:hypothetical protein
MMPRGPQGQKRPADTVANVTRVAKILAGEVEEDTGGSDKGQGRPVDGAQGRSRSRQADTRAQSRTGRYTVTI